MDTSRRSVLAGGIALSALAAGCAEESSPGSSAGGANPGGSTGGGDGPFKVGVCIDITGAGASLGQQQRQTTEMWIEKLKTQTVEGRRVEVIMKDNRSDPGEAARVTGELINSDKVDVIIGATRSGPSLAMAALATGAKVPMLSLAAARAVIEKDGKTLPWVFKTSQNDDVVIDRTVEILAKNGHRRIALMRDSTAFGEGIKELLDAKGKDKGISVIQVSKFEQVGTEFTAQAVEARDSKPDAILVWGIPPSAATVNKQLVTLAKGVPVYQGYGVATGDYLKIGVPEVNGTKLIAGRLPVAEQLPSTDKQKDLILRFVSDFKKHTAGEIPYQFAGYCNDAFLWSIEAFTKVGKDRQKIRDFLETARLVGVTGQYQLSPTDHSGLTKDALVEMKVENGQFKYVGEAS